MAVIQRLFGRQLMDEVLDVLDIHIGLFKNFKNIFQRFILFDLARASRGQKDLERGENLFRLLGQLKSGEAWHHEIGDQNIGFLLFDLAQGDPGV